MLISCLIYIDKYLLKSKDEIIKLWLENCVHLNMKVQFHKNDEIICGIFKSIDDDGNAMIGVGNKIKSYSSGVIEL